MPNTCFITGLSLLTWAVPGLQPTPPDKGALPVAETPQSVHDFTVKDIDGQDVPLAKYKGNVLLIVNVASK